MTPSPSSVHHLILVRQGDPESAAGCCCRITRDDLRWGDAPAEQCEAVIHFGDLYQGLRKTFGDRVTITVLDSINILAFLPLVVRDAIRFRVPVGAVFRAISSVSLATGVLDGRILYSGSTPPSLDVAVSLVEARLRTGGGAPRTAP